MTDNQGLGFATRAIHVEHGLTRLGIKVRFADLTRPEELTAALDASTRVVFCESPANPNCETLAQHPASMTHATYAPEERARHGISEGLVRLSVGLETCADLAADLRQALDSASAAP